MEGKEPSESREDRHKRLRREAYLKAKERSKAARIAAKSSPAAIERQLRLKERRRQAYLEAKARVKAKADERRAATEAERQEACALRDEAVLKALRPAAMPLEEGLDGRPKLRLIRGGK